MPESGHEQAKSREDVLAGSTGKGCIALKTCLQLCGFMLAASLSSISSSVEKGGRAHLAGLLRGFWGIMNVLSPSQRGKCSVLNLLSPSSS